ncbi:uncharacterized protein LOC100904586 [Galendromus occidentalis]|uniref:Uncharacterized protein LOC100904586 n=1 Tax=Galendromus occidentalis TaxID=34638 RepID=A0AAJ6QZ52_9ACAR|nr:uncharacterized protein LOC100904586 [Galendromus occidentalis]
MFASSPVRVALLIALVSGANCIPWPRNETVDLWDHGVQGRCPPFPNCAPGHTCAVYQHPNNCPVCKCVECPQRTCVPRRDELCHWNEDDGEPGCGGCRCEACPPVSQCQSGCFKVVPQIGCSFCKCRDSEKEVGHNRHTDANADETQRQKLESPGTGAADPTDP